MCLAALIGCGGTERRARRPGEEYVAAIRIDGNQAIPDQSLISGLALERARAAGRAIDPYQLDVDTQRIRVAYQRLGFFKAEVTSRIEAQGDALTAVFNVVEGDRAAMRVEFRGLPPEVPVDNARALIAIPDGAPFSYDGYESAKEPLRKLLENAGYASASIVGVVNADRIRNEAVVVFDIEPGPRATFGEIEIVGVQGQLADAIRDRATFSRGDDYSLDELTETQRSLYELGRFSSVRIEPQRGNPVVPIRVIASPSTRREVSVGTGFGADPIAYEARLRAGYRVVPAEAPLWSLGIDLRPALTFESGSFDDPQPKVRALATAERLELVRPWIRGEVNVGADYLTYEAFTTYGPRLGLGASAPLGVRWLKARAGWLMFAPGFRAIDPAIDMATQERLGIVEGIDVDRRVGAYQQSLVADLRDNPLDPDFGVYVDLRVREGSELAAGSFNYVQVTPDVRGYLPLWRTVLAARARYGAIFGEVPVTERYFAGGGSSHRGFATRRLSPVATSIDLEGQMHSVVIGGAAELETSIELRVPFVKRWGIEFGGVGFLDGGDVTDARSDLDMSNLHWATGGGLRAKVFGISVRLDVGYRLNRKGPSEPEYETGRFANLVLHLAVGEAF